MIELKIKKKYFDAILCFDKPFEIRHKTVKKGEKIKLLEIDSNRYIIFEAGKAEKINQIEVINFANEPNGTTKIISNEADEDGINIDYLDGKYFSKANSWYDDFCWEYIKEKQSYVIPIKKIIEVKEK